MVVVEAVSGACSWENGYNKPAILYSAAATQETFDNARKLNGCFIIIYPLTARVDETPQMISQPVASIFLSSPLPSGTWPTPGLSIP